MTILEVQQHILKFSNEYDIIIDLHIVNNLIKVTIPITNLANNNVNIFVKKVKNIAYTYYREYKLNIHLSIYDNVNEEEIYM